MIGRKVSDSKGITDSRRVLALVLSSRSIDIVIASPITIASFYHVFVYSLCTLNAHLSLWLQSLHTIVLLAPLRRIAVTVLFVLIIDSRRVDHCSCICDVLFVFSTCDAQRSYLYQFMYVLLK